MLKSTISKFFILISLLLPFMALSQPVGAINPNVTQASIHKTICVKGWTKTVRPSSYQTNKLKLKQIDDLDLNDKDLSHYEEDHLISLELGGSPDDINNLWPEPYAGSCGARVKDKIENKLKRLICAGKITLKAAQDEISTDWVASYRKHIGALSCY